jgi:putative transposase
VPREKRNIRPGVLYHSISRFVASEWFIKTDCDRKKYLDLVGSSLKRSDWSCLGYGVMSNHVHLALIAGESPLKSWLRDPHSEFAEWINDRYKRIGAVFVRGPQLRGVTDDGAASLIAYIHRNPVRAGVVRTAARSTWTSHRAYMSFDEAPSWLDTRRGLELMGFPDGALMDDWIEANPIERRELNEFRIRTKRKTRVCADAEPVVELVS